WRFKNFQRIKTLENPMRSLSPRTGQMGASLAAVAPDDETRTELVEYLTRRDAERHGNEPRGIVLQAINQLKAANKTSATVGEVAAIARSISSETGAEEMSARRVGSILHSIHIDSHRTKDGYVIDLTAVNVE